MGLHLYLEIINATISLFILYMVVYIVWFMIEKKNIVRSIMFLKGDRLKSPTIIASCGIVLFSIRETYKATNLLGFYVSEFIVEFMEFVTISMIFLGIFIVFRLFRIRIPK